MSRAFVHESDGEPESPPERPVSDRPNLVTPEGLRQIEERLRELEGERHAAKSAEDAPTLARIERDLRYFNRRRGSAQLIEPLAASQSVRFGVRVRLKREEGGEITYRLVGEDEAQPARGLLSWASPLAQSLLGKEVGDTVRFQGGELEIAGIES
ncbi:MAG: GreA/GreB family elongation factor [Steroidobacteraceae bacterium]